MVLDAIASEPYLEHTGFTEPGREGLWRKRESGSNPIREGTRGDVCPEPINRLQGQAPGEKVREVPKGRTLQPLRDNPVKTVDRSICP